MANQTNASTLYNSYEYYLDYLDLIPVDERKLKANKYLIVITFWASLAFFVMLLFLILLYMSWSGSSQARNNAQHHPTCPWSNSPHLPLCFRRHPPRLHRGRAKSQAAEHAALSSSCGHEPPHLAPPCSPPGTGRPWGPPTASADIRNTRGEPPPGDRTSQL
ncbi:PREDICTED: melanocortin-2 receptor accessory protein [Odobenus rosmarus divergens]|uniref:Melanocortin-2 receptor accessory protein n=1 Tax=Odobenus rosmarus divergens TaxID=9708 RepID=A0A9B0GWB8_ODORO